MFYAILLNKVKFLCMYVFVTVNVTLEKMAYIQDENKFGRVLHVNYPKRKMAASRVADFKNRDLRVG